MRKQSLIATMIIVLFLFLATVAQGADDPFAGTWKLNLAKSEINPGPPPKSHIMRITAGKITIDSVDANGKASHSEGPRIEDGKFYPVKGNPNYDEQSSTKVDANTMFNVRKKGGQEVMTRRAVIAKDGKTFTLTVKGRHSDTQEVNSIWVWDRQ